MDCLRQAHTTGIATTTLHDMVMQPLRASARLLSSTVARHAAGTHVYVPPTEPSPRYFVIATFLGGMAAMVYGGLHFLATVCQWSNWIQPLAYLPSRVTEATKTTCAIKLSG
eukprot:m.158290 g.158290  ORF g.158290 m.158290 type:complete len:112 (-) comp9821_c0_seq1:746-1081(-)